ncbi:TauD/TfdA family dioxygenase [Kitasatospora sp. NPDC048545]|uniref:TauD/TfdA family dioxygenase n=1 Tax=Kitasatospora sp. NPDC048545 TaxID=3157208 RepID=UPI003406C76A
MRLLELDINSSTDIENFVESVLDNTPSQSDIRFAEQVIERGRAVIPALAEAVENSPSEAIVLRGLPRFSGVAQTKILTLLLADCVGRLTAYADFNASVLTDIRPNPQSREQNAQPERLGMHNDFPFIADRSRPAFIVLVAHKAVGEVPRTLLAPADALVERLGPETLARLQQPRYTAVVGTKLAWREPRRFSFPLLVRTGGRWRVLYHFDTISTDPALPADEFEFFDAARRRLGELADELGFQHGHALRKGEALVVPNDHYLHGREQMETDRSDRLVFRAYATHIGARPAWESLMVRLDDE